MSYNTNIFVRQLHKGEKLWYDSRDTVGQSKMYEKEKGEVPVMGDNTYTMLLMLIPFAMLYFFMVRPQKKKEKAQAEMRSDIMPGDRVITIGGIIGRVVNVKDDTVTIETGSEKTRLKMMKAAISQREGKDEQQQQ